METEKQRLDDELTRAQKKISVSEKAVATLTIVEPVIYDKLKTHYLPNQLNIKLTI